MNYTELTQAIQDYCENDETTFVNNLDNFIRQAEERIVHGLRLPRFRKNSTGSTTGSVQYLTLPSDFLAPFSLAVVNVGDHEYLLQKDVNFIREAYPDPTVEGVPAEYAIWDDNTFLLGPTPNAALVMELHYFHKPPSIVVSSTSWMGDNAETILLYGCLVEAYTFMKGEEDMIALYDIRYKEALIRFKDFSEARNRKDVYRGGEIRREAS